MLPSTRYDVDYARFLLSGDVNNDGNIDLVSVTDFGISVLRGKGDGAFSPASNQAVSSGQLLWDVVLADFNKDGRLDMVMAQGTGVFLLRGDGDGSFAPPLMVGPPAQFGGLALGDLNGDGNPDLIVLSDQNTIIELQGKGDGGFHPPETLVQYKVHDAGGLPT